jgi:hypothetical protein
MGKPLGSEVRSTGWSGIGKSVRIAGQATGLSWTIPRACDAQRHMLTLNVRTLRPHDAVCWANN